MIKKLILLTVCAALFWLCSCSENSENINNKQEITDGDFEEMKILTYSLGMNYTNCYLVYGETSKKACLIDAPEYDDEIMDAILSKDLELEYIILTHGHFDHILGAEEFKKKTGAKIAVHELETEYLEDPDKSMTFLYNSEIISADAEFKDGDVLSFGGISLKVFHTPGHTKGSSFFVCDTEKIMFSGDTLFKNNIGRFDFYGGDYDILIASLQKLKSAFAGESDYIIYPGHGDATTLRDEIAENYYFRQ